jgi:Na+/proline symporter
MNSPTFNFATIDVVLIIVYLAATVAAGIWFRRLAARGVEGYFLGGRNLPGWMLGLSGAAANIDVSGTMVIVSWLFMLGINGYWCLMSGHTAVMMAVVAVLIGKWIRRSGVVTSNEYMELRFGRGAAGRLSRSISTAGQLLAVLAALTYFVIGTGKFFGPYLPFDLPSQGQVLLGGEEAPFFNRELVAALLVIGIGLAYSLVSGFAGVVGADMIQMGVILLAFAILTITAVLNTSPELLAGIAAGQPEWFSTLPPIHFDTSPYGRRYSGFEAMAVVSGFFLFKSVVQGFGAVQGYTAQRWLSCKTDRDAGIMSAVWLTTLVARWATVMGVALLGWVLVQTTINAETAQLLRSDPERIFPYVLASFLQPGLLGIVFAGLLAASLSTVVSQLNAGASFLVRDIYQEWIRPDAGVRETTIASYVAVLALVVTSVALSHTFKNINDIWTWLMAGWTGAKFVPMILFWYWHRANGVGFATGSGLGLAAAVMQRIFLPDASPMLQFFISGVPSCLGFILGSLLTKPVDHAVLVSFYGRIRPWGWWGPVKARFTTESLATIRAEHRRDVWAVSLAIPWLVLLYLAALLCLTWQWGRLIAVLAVLAALTWGLYRVWFRWLGRESPTPILRSELH